MKLVCWNVNGIRAAAKKGALDTLLNFDADIIGVQETKAQDDQVEEVTEYMDDYYINSNSAVKKGYSGTALFTKKKPVEFLFDMGVEEHDQEGRISCVDMGEVYVIDVYCPNSGQDLKRLNYRAKWDADFLKYLKKLEETKPIIVMGDFNVAHKPIDIARPKDNYNKSAGYCQEEIDGMENFLNAGLVDIWREQHPDEVKYSWWSWRAQARVRNVGWRIDYFLISKSLVPLVKSTEIHSEVEGSDHCPITMEIDL
ncbi:MAG: exodeoxyribonuclease-3 [Sphingobacteriales bacterium]|jgi:exodeoxyribonuclease-3